MCGFVICAEPQTGRDDSGSAALLGLTRLWFKQFGVVKVRYGSALCCSRSSLYVFYLVCVFVCRDDGLFFGFCVFI